MLGMTFTSKNGTGTGEIDVVIGTVDGIPVGERHAVSIMQDHCVLHYAMSSIAMSSIMQCPPFCTAYLVKCPPVVLSTCASECSESSVIGS